MSTSSDPAQKGYFDALTAGYFKHADGRAFFFPWGALGRGYAVPSQQRYESLRRQLKIYMIASLVLIIAPMAAQFYLTGFVIAGALLVFYLAWMPYLLRGLEASQERMSMGDNMATQARIHNAGTLWLMEIVSLLFVVGGIWMLMAKPDQWMMALVSIAFFGFCAAMFARMLILRRRTANGG